MSKNKRNQKLTKKDQRLIMGLIEHRDYLLAEASTLTYARIADKFAVHTQTVGNLVRRKRA